MDTSTDPQASHSGEEGQEEFKMASPHEDWKFNTLLLNISNGMTTKNLADAKSIFKGEGGIGEGVLEKIERPIELFDVLRRRTMLDRNNLLFLQAILYHTRRKDLLDLAVQYAHSQGDVIHYRSPPAEPANGYRFVQFHVEGTGVNRYTRRSLEELRRIAADLMFVPPQFVTISGIEPSSSLLITCMVPEICIEYLEEALKNEMTQRVFSGLGIGYVRINGNIISILGACEANKLETNEQDNTKRVYDQLKETQTRLEKCEMECIKMKRLLRQKSTEDPGSKLIAALIGAVWDTYQDLKVPKLSKQSAFAFFRFALREIRKLGYNQEALAFLLDAHSIFVTTRYDDYRNIERQALLMENMELRTRLFELSLRPRSQYISRLTEFESKLNQGYQPALLVPMDVLLHRPVAIPIPEYSGDEFIKKEQQTLLSKGTLPDKAEVQIQYKLKFGFPFIL